MTEQDVLADLAILEQYFMEVSMQVARDTRRAFEAEILLGEVLEKMTEQETIEKAIIGKRVVAVSWTPLMRTFRNAFDIESITLEGGITLKLHANFFDNVVEAEIEENKDADAYVRLTEGGTTRIGS